MMWLLVLCLMACQEDKPVINQEKSVQETKMADKISSIVRNPVSADNMKDTINVARIVFEETSYDFGTVNAGAKVEHTFRFKNTGKVNLLISEARATCGCTVPKWPKHPIAPGESGTIEVVFDTKNKKKRQSKPITIFANTLPAETKVYMKGNVEEVE